MATIKHVKDAARGRWPAILETLGVPPRLLNRRNHACPRPGCGGKDRWRFTNHNDDGCYICTHCGSGSGLDLLMMYHGWSIQEAKEQVERVAGLSTYKPVKTMRKGQRARMLNDLWLSSHAIEPSDPAARYLSNRCGLASFPDCLRANDSLIYKDDTTSFHPALVAMVQAADGSCQTLHRTFLSKDGEKAKVPSPRRLMPGAFAAGAAVRLMPVEKVLGVAEGIETALSASALFEVPVWAAINANNLAQFSVPEGIEELLVFGDADPKFAGQAAAYRLAERWANKGMRVSVHIPEILGFDWNDVEREGKRNELDADRHVSERGSGSLVQVE